MGGYLDKPITTKEYEECVDRDGNPAAVGDMQGWRKEMEDSHILRPAVDVPDGKHIGVYAVFDGHSGKEVARFCAIHFVGELVNAINTMNIETALKCCFHRMDEMIRMPEMEPLLRVLEGCADGVLSDPSSAEEMRTKVKEQLDKADEKGSLTKEEALHLLDMMKTWKQLQVSETNTTEDSVLTTQAGCTAIVVVRHGDKLYAANAGDSRAVLCVKGQTEALSFDHKPREKIEYARIVNAGGDVNEEGRVCGHLNLSRAIGDLSYKVNSDLPPESQIITAEPDIKIVDLTEDSDFFVIACDGIFDVKTSKELVEFIYSRLQLQLELKVIIEQLFDDCLSEDFRYDDCQGHLGTDNMTCVIVLLKPLSYFR